MSPLLEELLLVQPLQEKLPLILAKVKHSDTWLSYKCLEYSITADNVDYDQSHPVIMEVRGQLANERLLKAESFNQFGDISDKNNNATPNFGKISSV